MRSIITLFALVFITHFGFAQDKVSKEDLTVTITLSESDAMNAKSLKSIEHGTLSKGLNKYTFLITTDKEEIDLLKKELNTMFPTCKIEIAERE